MCTGLLACGLGLVVEGEFINFWLRVAMGLLALFIYKGFGLMNL
jgi:hypothetical protein